jgi:hypothetical protein
MGTRYTATAHDLPVVVRALHRGYEFGTLRGRLVLATAAVGPNPRHARCQCCCLASRHPRPPPRANRPWPLPALQLRPHRPRGRGGGGLPGVWGEARSWPVKRARVGCQMRQHLVRSHHHSSLLSVSCRPWNGRARRPAPPSLCASARLARPFHGRRAQGGRGRGAGHFHQTLPRLATIARPLRGRRSRGRLSAP